MSAVAIIESAAADGVTLALSTAGGIKAIGEGAVVRRWLPAIREHKRGIMAALAVPITSDDEAAIRAWLVYIGETDPDIIGDVLDKCRREIDARDYFIRRASDVPPPADFDDDDRRRCTQCLNLAANGRCSAAQRREIDAISTYHPQPDVLRRCKGYRTM